MKARVWVLGIAVGLPLTACKATGRSDAPSVDVRGWSLAEIEAELQRNDEVLAREGIMVASASVPPAPDLTEPATDAENRDQGALESEGDDDGGAPPLGAVEPSPAPEPSSEDAPATMTDEPDYADAVDTSSRPNRSRRARATPRREAGPSRCERVCELAEATCELETQICELAQRHPDEPRYARACTRAEQQCLAAARACDRCDE